MRTVAPLRAERSLPVLLETSNILKLLVFAVPLIVIFYPDVSLMGSYALVSDLYNYALLIPVLIGYFLVRKRHSLVALMNSGADQGKRLAQLIVGSSLVLSAFIVYEYGSGTTYSLDLHIMALQLFAAGEIALLFNLRLLRALVFPILLVCGAYYTIGQFALGFWTQIASSSGYLSASILSTLHYQVTLQDTSGLGTLLFIGGSTAPFDIGLASSGLYSLVGFCLFLAFVVYFTRGPSIRRALVVLLAFPLLWIVNVARIVIVIAAAIEWGTIGYDIAHLSGGIVLVFIATLLLLFISERFLHLRVFPSRSTAPDCDKCADARARQDSACPNCGKLLYIKKGRISRKYVVPIGIILVVSLLFVYSVVPAYAAATSPVQSDPRFMNNTQASDLIAPNSLNRSGWVLFSAVRENATQYLLESSGGGEYAVFAYSFFNNVTYAPFNIIVEISPGPPHLWETSVIAATVRAPLTSPKGLPTIFVDSDVPIPTTQPLVGKYFVYVWPGGPAQNNTVAVLYWIVQAQFPVGTSTQEANVEITIYSQDLPTLYKDGYLASPTDFTGLEALYTSLAQQIASSWNPKSGLGHLQGDVGNEAPVLLAIVLIPSLIVLGVWARNDLNAKRRAARAYRELPQEEKDLLKSLAVISLTEKPTTSKIAEYWAKSESKELSQDSVGTLLSRAENQGLIEKSISENDGEPIEIWRSNVLF